jgi:hypothetical protein
MGPNARGGDFRVSANEYSCTQEPKNFGGLTPYLTYGVNVRTLLAMHSSSGLLCIYVSKLAECCRGEPWRTDTSSPWPVIRSTCGCSALYSTKQVRRSEPLCFFKNQANLYTHVMNIKSKLNDPHLVTLSLNVPGIICSSGRFFLDSPEIFFTAAGL